MNCIKCGSQMTWKTSDKVLNNGLPGQAFNMSHSARNAKDPITAGIITAFSAIAGITNHFFVSERYTCPDCGHNDSKITRSHRSLFD